MAGASPQLCALARRSMARSSKANGVSGAKVKASARVAPKRSLAPAAKRAPVRSAARVQQPKAPAKAIKPPAKAAKVTPAKVTLAKAAKVPPSQPPAALPPRVRNAAAVAAALLPLRAEERRAVEQALNGKATLLASSPRARDAAIFSSVALASQTPTLVASPLAAELFAQATALDTVDVIALGNFVDASSRAASLRRIQRGGALLVVVDPASLFATSVQQAFAKTELAIVGVAAAHACSEHAHELSPAYLSLREALRAYSAPVLATCTRTAPRVVEQVAEAIGGTVIVARPPELGESAEVVRPTERKHALLSAISSYGAPGVVLTATSQEADAVYGELKARGVACARSHASMAPAERAAELARFSDLRQQLVLVTQSPHANASGLAGCAEASHGLESAPPRSDLRFVVHYQAPLSTEQLFEDVAWLAEGGASLVLADSSDAALVQAILAQQRIKPAAIEAMAQVLALAPEDRPAFADTLALRAGTSRRSAERVLSALADRNWIVRDAGQITRRATAEALTTDAGLLAARFATLRAADVARAEGVAGYVTSRHGAAPTSRATPAQSITG
jgi:hypothetical protein